MSLSQEQSHIVNLPIGRAVQVLASAGTGKTRVLTERIRYILENTKKDGVVALTFTNKAADEMENRLADCDQAEDRVWIATIHSVAQRILENYGHTIGLPGDLQIYDRDKDRMEVFMQSLREDGVDIDAYLDIDDARELKDREKNLNNHMSIFSKIKRELWTEADVSQQYPNHNIWKIYQDYQSSLLNSGGIDYDDILVHAREILLRHEWIADIYRSQYKHVCVDEAQDLNNSQYEFIKALCGTAIRSVLMVGDPNQMIYGFNGSSKEYLCQRFLADFSPASFELKKNYRSARAVIEAANKLRPDSQAAAEYAFDGCVHINGFDTEADEAEHVTATIRNLLDLETHEEIEGGITPDKIVVIARNRFVLSKLEESLQNKNVPYSLKKGERQQEPETKFGQVLDYALRVKLNPKDWVDGKRLCQTLEISEPDSWAADALLRMAKSISSDNKEMDALWVSLLHAIDDLDTESPNIPKFVQAFCVQLNALGEGNASNNGVEEEIQLSLKDLGAFNDAWTRFKRKGLGKSLLAFKNALALGQLSDSAANGGLTLSTVHTMKGLEKDIVFLIGMCEGVFPDYRATTRERIEEERNNAFVAVTRAKRWLYLSYPKQREMPWGSVRFQQKSRFIDEIERSVDRAAPT